MTSRKVFVSYDHEGDMLEVLWAFREGYFTPTDDERILKRLDDDGEVIGFLIHEMSTLKEPSPVEFELASEPPADDVANVTVREALSGWACRSAGCANWPGTDGCGERRRPERSGLFPLRWRWFQEGAVLPVLRIASVRQRTNHRPATTIS